MLEMKAQLTLHRVKGIRRLIVCCHLRSRVLVPRLKVRVVAQNRSQRIPCWAICVKRR